MVNICIANFARFRCNTNPSVIPGNYFFPRKITPGKCLPSGAGICRRVHTLSENSFVTHSEIEEVLQRNETPFKKGYAGYLTSCKQCTNVDDEHDVDLSMFVDMRTGDSVCRSCGAKYDWRTYKTKVNRTDIANSGVLNPIVFEFDKQKPLQHPQWQNSKLITESSKFKLASHFPLQNISYAMLQKFHVRSTENEDTLLFPYYDIIRQCVIGFKMYESKSKPLVVKEHEHLSLFGWHLIKPEHTNIVLTANELDSIAITMATGIPSLSLPYGVSTLPPDCLPFFEQFNDIIFWFGDEYRAKENLQRFATKLSLSRCSQVTANNGASLVFNEIGKEEVERCIGQRRPLSHDDIVSFKELRNELLNVLINAKENAGVPFTRFPILNEYLKGHRRGELTIFTGPTGSGKTTFLSELSLDLCTQGVKTLWGSFEIKNVRLANIMLHQYSGIALEDHMDKFSHWSEQFEGLPMYFMSYYGAQSLKRVLKTIEYAIYTYDIEHVIIDNLQFMVNANNGDDRFQLMDNAIASFRKCASKHNVHVTVVIHPRKEIDGSVLQTSSIYGSAKASQEADNVLILQALDETSMQVSKNRFSGTIGVIPLCFNPSSLCLSGFHRIVESGEAILPALKPKRLIQNLNIIKKKR